MRTHHAIWRRCCDLWCWPCCCATCYWTHIDWIRWFIVIQWITLSLHYCNFDIDTVQLRCHRLHMNSKKNKLSNCELRERKSGKRIPAAIAPQMQSYIPLRCLSQCAPARAVPNSNVKLKSRPTLPCNEMMVRAYPDTVYPSDHVRHLNSTPTIENAKETQTKQSECMAARKAPTTRFNNKAKQITEQLIKNANFSLVSIG